MPSRSFPRRSIPIGCSAPRWPSPWASGKGRRELHAAELQLAQGTRVAPADHAQRDVRGGKCTAANPLLVSGVPGSQATSAGRGGDWVKGSRMRYENPQPAREGQNWLLQSLNDYLAAIRFRIDAATEAAAVLARYNADLVPLEEIQGTLLASSNIELAYDPCQQLWRYGVSAAGAARSRARSRTDPPPATEPSGPSRLVPPARTRPGHRPLRRPPPLPADPATPVGAGRFAARAAAYRTYSRNSDRSPRPFLRSLLSGSPLRRPSSVCGREPWQPLRSRIRQNAGFPAFPNSGEFGYLLETAATH